MSDSARPPVTPPAAPDSTSRPPHRRGGTGPALAILAVAGLALAALVVLTGSRPAATAVPAPPTTLAASPFPTDAVPGGTTRPGTDTTTRSLPNTVVATAAAPAPAQTSMAVAVGAGAATDRCWAAVAPPAGPPLLGNPQLLAGGGALWLFGASDNAGQPVSRLARWDGARWVAAPAPPAAPNSDLTGLIAPAPNDLWAAGVQRVATSTVALLEHGDGRQWAAVPAPGGAAFAGLPVVLAATGPGDVWAGGSGSNVGAGASLLLHWDGRAWQDTAAPVAGPGAAILTLAAVAPGDAWAAGARDQDLALALHWNGRAWQPVPLPAGMGRPAALAAPAADHVWLAGRTADHQPVLLRWTGQTWRQLPRPLGGSSFLIALAAAGPEDLWTLAATEGQDVPTQVLHWITAGWTAAPQPAVPAHTHLTSLVVGPDGALWVAGSYSEDISGVTRTLVLRYGPGPCATPTPARAVAAQPTRPFTLPGPVPTAVSISVAAPGSGDHYIFAFRATSPHNSLVAYDYERQTEIPLRQFAGTGYEVSHIASDGQIVVWVQNHPPGPPTVEGYDLRTHAAFRVAQAAAAQTGFGGLAVARGMVYYAIASYPTGAPGPSGLYAHPPAGGTDTLIAAAGRDPVTGDSVLLWQEAAPVPIPTLVPGGAPPPTEDPNDPGARMVLPGSEDCTLHLRTLDASVPDRVIAHFSRLGEGGSCFAGYAVSGDHVVWTENGPGPANLMLYTRSTGLVQPIAAVPFLLGVPLIAGPLVVWAGAAAADPGQVALLGYRIDTGAYLQLLPQAPAPLQPQFILDGRTVVYSSGPGAPGTSPARLYAVDVPGP